MLVPDLKEIVGGGAGPCSISLVSIVKYAQASQDWVRSRSIAWRMCLPTNMLGHSPGSKTRCEMKKVGEECKLSGVRVGVRAASDLIQRHVQTATHVLSYLTSTYTATWSRCAFTLTDRSVPSHRVRTQSSAALPGPPHCVEVPQHICEKRKNIHHGIH